MADTCDQCAARDRATLERAARWLEEERGRYSSADELRRMYADTPAACDCAETQAEWFRQGWEAGHDDKSPHGTHYTAARDRVVEAAVEWRDLIRTGAMLPHVEERLMHAVAALEGAPS